jgi:hypothetical protein
VWIMAALQEGQKAVTDVPWRDLSYASLFFAAVWLLLTGRLVTRAGVRDLEKQRDIYKESWEKAIAAFESLETRVDANTQALNTVERAMSSILRRD